MFHAEAAYIVQHQLLDVASAHRETAFMYKIIIMPGVSCRGFNFPTFSYAGASVEHSWNVHGRYDSMIQANNPLNALSAARFSCPNGGFQWR